MISSFKQVRVQFKTFFSFPLLDDAHTAVICRQQMPKSKVWSVRFFRTWVSGAQIIDRLMSQSNRMRRVFRKGRDFVHFIVEFSDQKAKRTRKQLSSAAFLVLLCDIVLFEGVATECKATSRQTVCACMCARVCSPA